MHKAIPRYGHCTFNCSHYEEARSRGLELVPENIWKSRYAQINSFEEMLTENGIVILKFFCTSTSKEEQADALRARL